MPCYQVVEVSVEFKVESVERLKKTLERLGHSFSVLGSQIKTFIGQKEFTFDLDREKLTFDNSFESKEVINQIKRKYSELALEEVAKKRRWILKNKGENKFAFIKY